MDLVNKQHIKNTQKIKIQKRSNLLSILRMFGVI